MGLLLPLHSKISTPAEKQTFSAPNILPYSALVRIVNDYLFTKQALGCFSRCAGHNSRTAYPPSPLGVFSAHKMPAAGTFVPDFAGSRNLDSLAQTLMGLPLRHFKILSKKMSKTIDKYKLSSLSHLHLPVNTAVANSLKKLKST
jgi:hypothetical protein